MKMNRISRSLCYRNPYLSVRCDFGFRCDRCTVADGIRSENINKISSNGFLFDQYDTLPKTPKFDGANYLYRPLVLSVESLKARSIDVNAYNQIVVSVDGAGMYSPGCELDCYFVSSPGKIYTFSRGEILGVPNEKAIKKFNELFFIDLRQYWR